MPYVVKFPLPIVTALACATDAHKPSTRIGLIRTALLEVAVAFRTALSNADVERAIDAAAHFRIVEEYFGQWLDPRLDQRALKAPEVDLLEMRGLILLFLRILQAELDRASVSNLALPLEEPLPIREGESGFTTMSCWFQYVLSERIAEVLIVHSHLEDSYGEGEASEEAFYKALAIANQLTLNHNSFYALHSAIRCGSDRLANDAAAKSKFGKRLHAVVYDLSITLSTHTLKKWLYLWTLVISALMSERSEGYNQATTALVDKAHEKAMVLWRNKRWFHEGSKLFGFHGAPGGCEKPLQFLLYRIFLLKFRMLHRSALATLRAIGKELVQTPTTGISSSALLANLQSTVHSLGSLFSEAEEINVILPFYGHYTDFFSLYKLCEISKLYQDRELVAQLGQILHDDGLQEAVSDSRRMEFSVVRCSSCGEANVPPKTFQKCGHCGTVRYCSLDCQRRHWREGHKAQCSERCLARVQAGKRSPPKEGQG